MQESPIAQDNDSLDKRKSTKTALYLVGTLLLFLFAISFMVASLQHMGSAFTETILVATSNPFTGLFIGLLITAIFQSSSTITSMVIALVASHAITVSAAVPIVMGANIGTTITSTVVSFGFINRKKEYRRALAAGTYHDFFNILTALILFPLEWYYGFLSRTATSIATTVFQPVLKPVGTATTGVSFGMDKVVAAILEVIPYPIVLPLFSLALLFASILIFRRISSNLLQAKKPEVFRKFFFENRLKSFLWGVITTAAIRSSTITTSIVVPIVARKISSLKKAVPFILGANIGTTVTGFIAIFLNADTVEAMTIALVHFLFNAFGVIIFLFVPGVKDLPLMLANRLGDLTLKNRFVGLIYLLLTFFLIPFTLIYLNR